MQCGGAVFAVRVAGIYRGVVWEARGGRRERHRLGYRPRKAEREGERERPFTHTAVDG